MSALMAFKNPTNGIWHELSESGIYFKLDIWNLSDLIKHNSDGKTTIQKIINFTKIQNSAIRYSLKQYAWISLGALFGKKEPQTVAANINQIYTYFIPFLNVHGISSLSSFTSDMMLAYMIWLRDDYQIKFRPQKRPLAPTTLMNAVHAVENWLNTVYEFGYDEKSIEHINFIEKPFDFFQVRKYIKNRQKIDRFIDDHIFERIINVTRKEPDTLFKVLCNKNNLQTINYAKFGILIQALTGIRIEELLTMEYGWVWKEEKNNKTYYWAQRVSTKTEVEPTKRNIIIPKEAYEAFKILEKLTSKHREITGLNSLFITKNNKDLGAINTSTWNKNYLSKLLARHMLPTNITSHRFRHTFAYRLVNYQNVPTRVIQAHYAHVSPVMTAKYIKIKKDRLIEETVTSFIIYNETILSNGKEGDEFKDFVKNVLLNKSLSDAIEALGKLFGINPLPFGMCLVDYETGHCPNHGVKSCYSVGCTSFTTNSSFLNQFKHQKIILENEIQRATLNKLAWNHKVIAEKQLASISNIIKELEINKKYPLEEKI